MNERNDAIINLIINNSNWGEEEGGGGGGGGGWERQEASDVGRRRSRDFLISWGNIKIACSSLYATHVQPQLCLE